MDAVEALPGRYLVLGVVSTAFLMASIDQTIVATALPTLQRELHAPVNWSTWTITIYALGQVLIMPMAGKLSELFGRKRVFMTAVAVFTVASLLCGLANDIYVLVALRGLQALGGGAFMPSATGIVAAHFGPDRDRAVGLFSSIFPIGGVAGPILGSIFVTYWSWRWIFLVNVPVGFALLTAAWFVLPRNETRELGPDGQRERFDTRGVGLLAFTVLSLMFGVAQLGSGVVWWHWTVLPPVVAGAGGAVLLVRHINRVPAPFIPPEFLHGRVFGSSNLLNFLFGAAALGLGALVPLYAQERYGIASLAAGTLLTSRAICMTVVAGLTVALLRRTGYHGPMSVGLLVLATGLVLLAIKAPDGSTYRWLALGAAITGIGMGLFAPTSNNAALHLAPGRAASISGLRGMFRQIGGITGISVASAILARSSHPGATQAWILAGFAVVLVAVIPIVRVLPEKKGAW